MPEAGVQARTDLLGARDLVGENVLLADPGVPEGVQLELEVLIGGADPCVTY
jgi:hypothetical protein